MEQEQTDIKAKIAELKQKYARLVATYGGRHISTETVTEYAKIINALEKKLN